MQAPPFSEPNEAVELDLLKGEEREESSGETKAFQNAMENLYPGRFISNWMIAIFVLFILGFFVPIFYITFTTAKPMVLLSVFAFPPVILMFWIIFWWKDRDKATFSGIAKFYLFGVLIIIPVAIIEYVEALPWTLVPFDNVGAKIGYFIYMSFIVAAFSEENAKFICYFQLKNHSPTITHPYTVVILMASTALGFASFETYGYITLIALQNDLVVTLVTVASRAILSLPIHTITGILIGCNLTKHFFKDAMDCKIYWQTLWQPFLLHAVFDLFAFTGSLGDYFMILYSVNVLLVIVGAWLCYKRINEVKLMVVDTGQQIINSLV